MPFAPWGQQAALPPGAPQEAPPQQPKNWWEQGAERMRTTGGFTWPWQEEHWKRATGGWGTAAKVGLGVGLGAGGALLGGVAAPAAASWLSGMAPWLTGAALPIVSHPTALGALGGFGGLMASSFMGPGEQERMPTAEERAAELAQFGPTAPGEPAAPTLPAPGAPGEGVGPAAQPQVIEVGGQTFWWNPTGGIYGEGGWDLISAKAPGLTPEQQIQLTQEEREHQEEMLQLQYQLEQRAMGEQAGYSREQQAAAAAQQMAQMYAADPYKYWAQMGQGTPGAVAALTGGQIAPGEEFGGVPLSTPSAQWWQNLLPSEQQQIAGGLNWMGVDPQDWYSMYQRMIPGLGQRQITPSWAR